MTQVQFTGRERSARSGESGGTQNSRPAGSTITAQLRWRRRSTAPSSVSLATSASTSSVDVEVGPRRIEANILQPNVTE